MIFVSKGIRRIGYSRKEIERRGGEQKQMMGKEV
jgi:hypothetical protein